MDAVKTALVVGLGKSGQAVTEFLLGKGVVVHGVDSNVQLLQSNPIIASLAARGAIFHHDSACTNLSQFDLLVTSPGIPDNHPLIQEARHRGIKVIGEVTLACYFLAGRKMIGITGTNGKTTVTLLVSHVLNSSGIAAKALGNIGVPLISEVCKGDDARDVVMVVELSSYQLETLAAPVLDAAVILNITPDHLDRYPDMDSYAAAKWRITGCLKAHGICYVEEQTLAHYHQPPTEQMKTVKSYGFSVHSDLYTDGRQVFIGEQVMFDLPHPYYDKKNHDVENLLAAYALCHNIGLSAEQFVAALRTFNKPPHRIEFVREINGVKFYDDSKGTNTDAVLKAVSALRTEKQQAKIFLIAGGVDKGWSYQSWIEGFHQTVSAIYAIGQAAKKMEEELGQHLPVERCASLEEAVQQAARAAKCGDYVLLSPGCASFDMFRDYAHRGEEFKKIVKQL